MSSTTVMILSVVGIAIGGAQGHWQLHAVDPVFDMRFWLGLAFGILSPIGTYFVGLVQRSPFGPNAMVRGSTVTKTTVTKTPKQDKS